MNRLISRVKHHSIRTRMLLLLCSVVVMIFLIVFLGFNLFLEDYITTSVYTPLQKVATHAQTPIKLPLEIEGDGGETDFPVPPRYDNHWSEDDPENLGDPWLLPVGPLDKIELMVLSEDYEILYPDEVILKAIYTEAPERLASAIKAEMFSLSDSEIREVTASGRDYYFMSIKLSEVIRFPRHDFSDVFEEAFIIYYIDMTAIGDFADRVNLFLILVLGIASAFAVMMSVVYSGRMAQPIKALAQFAGRIGRGDFRKISVHYNQLELIELAERMNQAADQLSAYDNEQKTFFQNVSHEFRTPLQVIRSNAEGIKYEILAPKAAGEVIIKETYRLTEMVEDLLYLSRVDQVVPTAGIEVYDLREILSAAAEHQRSLARERGIKYVFDFEDLPVNCLCDENRLMRAFSNVISNAIRYAQKEIVFSCKMAAGVCVVKISDDGMGISESDRPNIFKRFYKGQGGNHGIGLAIVKSIVDQHKAHVNVQSSSQGTTFVFEFQKNV